MKSKEDYKSKNTEILINNHNINIQKQQLVSIEKDI